MRSVGSLQTGCRVSALNVIANDEHINFALGTATIIFFLISCYPKRDCLYSLNGGMTVEVRTTE